MKHSALIPFAILILSPLFVSAQQKSGTDLSDKNLSLDSTRVNNGFQGKSFATDMPTYNPINPNAKILVLEPSESWMYQMPVIGNEEGGKFLGDLSKSLFKNWPGDINKDQEDEPAEHK